MEWWSVMTSSCTAKQNTWPMQVQHAVTGHKPGLKMHWVESILAGASDWCMFMSSPLWLYVFKPLVANRFQALRGFMYASPWWLKYCKPRIGWFSFGKPGKALSFKPKSLEMSCVKSMWLQLMASLNGSPHAGGSLAYFCRAIQSFKPSYCCYSTMPKPVLHICYCVMAIQNTKQHNCCAHILLRSHGALCGANGWWSIDSNGRWAHWNYTAWDPPEWSHCPWQRRRRPNCSLRRWHSDWLGIEPLEVNAVLPHPRQQPKSKKWDTGSYWQRKEKTKVWCWLGPVSMSVWWMKAKAFSTGYSVLPLIF